jgi:antibiotic biosynthesis monooxygenase (ABM) superfamily enzyme
MWLAIFPLITVFQALLALAPIDDWPLVARTLLTTVIMLPVMVFVVMPTLVRLFAGWLVAGEHAEADAPAVRPPYRPPARV